MILVLSRVSSHDELCSIRNATMNVDVRSGLDSLFLPTRLQIKRDLRITLTHKAPVTTAANDSLNFFFEIIRKMWKVRQTYIGLRVGGSYFFSLFLLFIKRNTKRFLLLDARKTKISN